MLIYGCSFLELDVLYITIQNEFQWIGGDKNEMGAVHLEILTVTVSPLHLHVFIWTATIGYQPTKTFYNIRKKAYTNRD